MKEFKISPLVYIPCAAALAGTAVYYIVAGSTRYEEYEKTKEQKEVLQLEQYLTNCQMEIGKQSKIYGIEENLLGLSDDLLSKDQKRRKYLILGDISLKYFENPNMEKNHPLYAEMATKYYRLAMRYSASKEEKNAIIRRNAELHIKNKDWKMAYDLFRRTESYDISPKQRRHFRLMKAECLIHLKKYYEAYKLLSSVMDESIDDKWGVWGTSLRMKTDLLVEAVNNDEVLRKFVVGMADKGRRIDKKLLSTYKDRFLDEAKRNYELLMKEMPAASSERSKARLGILSINVTKSKNIVDKRYALFKKYEDLKAKSLLTKEAMESIKAESAKLKKAWAEEYSTCYKLANNFRASAMSSSEKARSLDLIADMNVSIAEFEKKLKRAKSSREYYVKAMRSLDKSLERFPLSPRATDVSIRLYNLCKMLKMPEKAFRLVTSVLLTTDDPEVIHEALMELSPGRNEMFRELITGIDKEEYLENIAKVLNTLKNNPRIWAKIKNDFNLVHAELLYYSGKYNKAEKAVVKYINTSGNSNQIIEELYFLDILCADKLKESPAVIISRSKRYLNEYPQGKNYREVLLKMLKNYYKMGFYDEAITVSKQLILDTMKWGKDKKKRDIFLETLAMTSRCYEKMGLYEKSGKKIDAYSDMMLKKPYAPEVFMIWADDAEFRGQMVEAIRRLELVIPETHHPAEKAKLIVARYLLKLSMNDSTTYEKSKKMLEKIEETKKLQPAEKKELRRKLFEGMLEYAFRNKMSSDINELLGRVMVEFKNESWPEYWILQSLSPFYDGSDLVMLSKRYEKTLKSDFAYKAESTDTFDFIRRQLELLNALVEIDESVNKLKEERDL